MNTGHLKNELLVNEYKHFGFSTRTQLIDAALDLLREKLEDESREKWKREAFKSYLESGAENLWGELDAEDFYET